MKLSLSIVIPNYNGVSLLERYLPSVIQNAKGSQIIIVDDASTDNSVGWIKTHYPKIKVIEFTQNQGFAAAVNAGFKTTTTDLVLLLNSDVGLYPTTIEALISHFNDADIFAVGAVEELPDGTERGKSEGYFERGFIVHRAARQLSPGPTFWVFAASGMFNRKIWNKLGGLDERYKPAYWEDIDLGYRAWKAGYTLLFEPKAQVKHQGEATMNPTLGGKKTAYVFKNQLLFFWKNVNSGEMWLQYFYWLPYHLIITSYRTKGSFARGFMLALVQALRGFPETKALKSIRHDREILAQFN